MRVIHGKIWHFSTGTTKRVRQQRCTEVRNLHHECTKVRREAFCDQRPDVCHHTGDRRTASAPTVFCCCSDFFLHDCLFALIQHLQQTKIKLNLNLWRSCCSAVTYNIVFNESRRSEWWRRLCFWPAPLGDNVVNSDVVICLHDLNTKYFNTGAMIYGKSNSNRQSTQPATERRWLAKCLRATLIRCGGLAPPAARIRKLLSHTLQDECTVPAIVHRCLPEPILPKMFSRSPWYNFVHFSTFVAAIWVSK